MNQVTTSVLFLMAVKTEKSRILTLDYSKYASMVWQWATILIFSLSGLMNDIEDMELIIGLLFLVTNQW